MKTKRNSNNDEKNIIVLYTDGHVESKSEGELSKSDVDFSDYILVQVSPNKTYSIIPSTKYLLFHHAAIRYRLCELVEFNDDEPIEVYELKPIEIFTSSLCDVIGLINTIPRFCIVNNLVNDEMGYESTRFGISEFQLLLFDEFNNEIFHEEYFRNGTSSIPYDPFQILKHFKKIYNPYVVSNLFVNDKYVYLYTVDNVIKWEISTSDISTYDMIGLAHVFTESITFLYKDQYEALSNLFRVNIVGCVYYETNEIIDSITKLFYKRKRYFSIDRIVDDMHDVYVYNHNDMSLANNKASISKTVESISHAQFILNTLNLMYSELYGSYSNEYAATHSFDSFIVFNFKKHSYSDISQICMNMNTIVPLDVILDAISCNS